MEATGMDPMQRHILETSYEAWIQRAMPVVCGVFFCFLFNGLFEGWVVGLFSPWCFCGFFFGGGWFESHLRKTKNTKTRKKLVGFLVWSLTEAGQNVDVLLGVFLSELCWLETVGVYKVAGIGRICSIYSWFVWRQVYLVS